MAAKPIGEDYPHMLEQAGLGRNQNRLAILTIVGDSPYPLTAHEILTTLTRTRPINRVTVYRILDLLVRHGLVQRLSAGDRAFRYGLAGVHERHNHPHFYCTECGSMECLAPEAVSLDVAAIQRTMPALIQQVEIRLDGVCKNCLRRLDKNNPSIRSNEKA